MSEIKLDQLPKNTSGKASSGSAGRWWKLLVAGILLVYMLSPVDFIPEAIIPVIGLADDLVAAVGMILSVISALKTGRYNPNARMEQRADEIFGKDNY